jgi:hypothetical protein
MSKDTKADVDVNAGVNNENVIYPKPTKYHPKHAVHELYKSD